MAAKIAATFPLDKFQRAAVCVAAYDDVLAAKRQLYDALLDWRCDVGDAIAEIFRDAMEGKNSVQRECVGLVDVLAAPSTKASDLAALADELVAEAATMRGWVERFAAQMEEDGVLEMTQINAAALERLAALARSLEA